MGFISRMIEGFLSLPHESWVWFNSLNHEECIILLGSVAAFGFLCMRGFSGRGNI